MTARAFGLRLRVFVAVAYSCTNMLKEDIDDRHTRTALRPLHVVQGEPCCSCDPMSKLIMLQRTHSAQASKAILLLQRAPRPQAAEPGGDSAIVWSYYYGFLYVCSYGIVPGGWIAASPCR